MFKKYFYSTFLFLLILIAGACPAHAVKDLNIKTDGSSLLFVEGATGNMGVGTTQPVAKLQVGISPTIPVGAVPAAAIKGNLVVDGKIYGDASGLSSVPGAVSGLTPTSIPKAATASTLVDSTIYEVGGNVGIGSASPRAILDIQAGSSAPSKMVNINGTFADLGGSRAGLYVDVVADQVGAGGPTGSWSQVRTTANAGTYTNAITGAYDEALHAGSAQADFLIGALTLANQYGNGNVSNAYGIYPQVWKGSGTITNAYGMYFDGVPDLNPDTNVGIGTVVNQYGIAINKLTTGSTRNIGLILDDETAGAGVSGNYGVYAEVGYDNYFAGNIGVGTAKPDAQLKLYANTTNTIDIHENADTTGAYGNETHYKAGNATDNRATPSPVQKFRFFGGFGGFQEVVQVSVTTPSAPLGVGQGAINFATQAADGLATRMIMDSNIYIPTNVGIGSSSPVASLQVGVAPTIPAGASPAAAVKGDLVVDGKIYGDGSFLTGLPSGISGLNAGYIPQASSSTTIVDSVIYQNGSNIGIGTVNPSSEFQIYGGSTTISRVSGNSWTSQINVTDAGGVYWEFGSVASPNSMFTLSSAGGTNNIDTKSRHFRFFSSTIPSSRPIMSLLYNTGNVGIGTLTPWAKLHIIGTGTTVGVAFKIDDNLYVPKVTVLDNGNVGLGTVAPTATLHLGAGQSNAMPITGADAYIAGNLEVDGKIYGDGSQLFGVSGTDNTKVLKAGDTMTGGLTLSPVSGDALITTAGNVGIGTSVARAELDVDGEIYVSGNIGLGTATTMAKLSFVLDTVSSGGINFGGDTNLYRSAANTLRTDDSINVNGGVTLSSTGLARLGALTLLLGDSTDTVNIGNNTLYVLSATQVVGIGTSVPRGRLEIVGAGTTTGVVFQVDDNLYTPKVTIFDNGNVGLGTVTPTAVLQLGAGQSNAMPITGADAYIAGNLEVDGKIYGDGSQLINLPSSLSGLNAGYIPQASSSTTIVDSAIYQNGSNIGIGSVEPGAKLDIVGAGTTTGNVLLIRDSSQDIKVMVLDNGNVGVGTTRPNVKLEITGSTNIPATFLRINNGASTVAGAGALDWYNSASGYNFQIARISAPMGSVGNNSKLNIEVADTSRVLQNRMAIDVNGNAGIGTTTPVAKLEVVGAGSTTGVAFQVDDTAYSPKVTVLDNGNVGIGSASPQAPLNIFRTQAGSISTYIYLDTNSYTAGSGAAIDFITTAAFLANRYRSRIAGVRSAAGGGASELRFYTDSSVALNEAMRIDYRGNVGIGTAASFAKLQVDGNIYIPAGLGNVGIGTFDPQSNLEVGSATTIPAGSSPVVAVKGNLVVDGKIYGDGSQLINLPGAISGLNAGYITQASSSTTIVDSAIYQNGSNIGIGSVEPGAKLDIVGAGSTTGKAIVVRDAALAARFTVLENGNVGIGSSNPGQKLVVSSYVQSNGGFYPVIGTTYGYITNVQQVYAYGPGGVLMRHTADIASGNAFSLEPSLAGTPRGLTSNNSEQPFLNLAPRINQSGTANYIGILLDVNEVGLGSGRNDLMDLRVGGASRVTVTNSGYIGIGSVTPQAKLEVVGSGTAAGAAFQIDDNLYVPKVTVLDNGNVGLGTVTPTAVLQLGAGQSNAMPITGADAYIAGNLEVDGKIYGDGSEITGISATDNTKVLKTGDTMTGGLTLSPVSGDALVTTAGNVGIGSSVPNAKLDIVGLGTSSDSSSVTVRDSAGNIKLAVLDNGQVGVGTSAVNSSYAFQVNTTLTYGVATNRSIYAGGNVIVGTQIGFGNSNELIHANNASHYMYFRTNSTERLRINSDGNVGIGTSTPAGTIDIAVGTTGGPTFLISSSGGAGTHGDFLTVTSTGNMGLGSTAPEATLQVGSAPTIPTGSSPAVAIKGNLVVDGEIYGDGSLLTGLPSGISGLNAGYIPQASSSTSIVDSAIYQNGSNIGIGSTNPTAQLSVTGQSGSDAVYVATTGTAGTTQDYNLWPSGIRGRSQRAGVMGITTYNDYYYNGSAGVVGISSSSAASAGVMGIATANGSSTWDGGYGGALTGWSRGGAPALAVIHEAGDNYGPVIGGRATGIGGTNYLDLLHTTSTFTGNTIFLEMARGSGSFTGNFMKFNNNNLTKFVVKSDGNTGIGTSAPFSKLEVDGNIYLPAGLGNIGIGTVLPQANLEVGAATTIPSGSNPVAAVKGNLVVDGKLYGDGSALTGLSGGISGLNAGYIPQASSATTIVDSTIYQNGSNIGVGSIEPGAKLDIVAAGSTTGRALVLRDVNLAPKVTVLDNGNVGIGSTQPNLKLTVNGDVALPNAGKIRFDEGVGAYIGESSNGIVVYGGSNGTVQAANFDGNGNARFVSSGANVFMGSGQGGGTPNSNVGIGTTTPQALLQLGGAGAVPNAMNITGSDAYIKGNLEVDGKIYGDGSLLTGLSSGISGLNAGYIPQASSSTTIVDSAIYQNASNIGIGSIEPGARLDIVGAGSTTGKVLVVRDANLLPRITVQDNGNVGIGSTTPKAGLEIKDTVSNLPLVLRDNYYSYGFGYAAYGWGSVSLSIGVNGGRAGIGGATNTFDFLNSSGQTIATITNTGIGFGGVAARTTPYLYISTTSNVGISTTTPRARLEVVGSGTATATVFQIDDNLYNPKITVLDNGNVGIGTTVPTSTFQLLNTATMAIPNGANPTVIQAGQVSVDTSATSGGMLRVFTDAERAMPTYFSKAFLIVNPAASSDYPVWKVPYAITIRGIHVLVVGGTNVVGGLDETDANGTNAVAIDADITATAGTNANDDGSLTNPTLDAGDYLYWHTTSVSVSPTSVTVTFDYTVDPVN